MLGETKGINAFLRTVKRSPSLAARVKRLTLDGWESTGDHRRGRGRRTVTGRLSQVLQLCRHLTELEIKGAIVFSLTDFAGAESECTCSVITPLPLHRSSAGSAASSSPTHRRNRARLTSPSARADLLHLTLTQTLLSDRTTTSRYHPFFTVLRSLHSLSLSQTTFDAPTAAHFLCPTTLPRLKVLEMDGGVGLVDDPTTQRGLGGYEPLLVGEQIEFLRLGGGGGGRVGGGRVEGEAGEGEAGFVQHCPTLQGLSLPLSTISDALLASLPPTLSWLEIRSGSEVMETHHLAAARALATTLLALAPSGSCTPGGLSRSPSSTLLSVSVSPTGGGLASFAHSGEEEGQGSPLPLSGLGRLLLPPEWEAWSGGGGAGGERGERGGGGEMSWAMGRIGRVAEARGVGVTFASASGSGVGEAARRWEGEGERE